MMNRLDGRTVDVTFPADAYAPHAARVAVAPMLDDLGEDVSFRVGLLVSDAIADRVLHQAAAGGGGRVRLELSIDHAVVSGRVSDVWADARHLALPRSEPDLVSIVRETLADSSAAVHAPDGTVSISFEIRVGPVRSTSDYASRFAASLAAAAPPAAAPPPVAATPTP
jgi:hypothetical protein